MEKVEAYISLGSNVGDGEEMLAKARDAIAKLPGLEIMAASPVYRTEPQDFTEQPWFRNQALKVGAEKAWTPQTLLRALLLLEKELGRVRGSTRFGPRRIDMDLLLYGAATVNQPDCIIPHPRMLRRAFVLVPLADIAPYLDIMGKTPAQWLGMLDWRCAGDRIYQQ